MLAEAIFLSVDPYMRAYVDRLQIGQVMIGGQVAKFDFPLFIMKIIDKNVICFDTEYLTAKIPITKLVIIFSVNWAGELTPYLIQRVTDFYCHHMFFHRSEIYHYRWELEP